MRSSLKSCRTLSRDYLVRTIVKSRDSLTHLKRTLSYFRFFMLAFIRLPHICAFFPCKPFWASTTGRYKLCRTFVFVARAFNVICNMRFFHHLTPKVTLNHFLIFIKMPHNRYICRACRMKKAVACGSVISHSFNTINQFNAE